MAFPIIVLPVPYGMEVKRSIKWWSSLNLMSVGGIKRLTGGPNRRRPRPGERHPLNMSGRSNGHITISVTHFLACSRPAFEVESNEIDQEHVYGSVTFCYSRMTKQIPKT
jgi:hypothetical protein